ncbi:NAD(P)/FAD-dependent oxidoreductase [Cognatishimia activa]|uniref:NAD(P)/FAD-dependent oxidoreductase n=1 Tax=Cognatishimia activa TaxID=1715691 RepID=UPI002232355C|nr:FAD-dependent oxidoreductase [Cognatishimia activa]UZD91321.1 FAD-binding oxidoreductase [Cognatishimia activa]
MIQNTPPVPPVQQSLWQATAPPDTPHASLEDQISADVTIIGAGFTGLRTALNLVAAGTKVVVLDAADVAWGASGRTGGQVNPLLPFNSPKQLHQLLGDTYFERVTEASLNSADELFELVRTYQIECQARQKGWLRVNHSSKAHRASLRDIENWRAYGSTAEVVEGDELNRLSGTKSYLSGVITHKGGAVHPKMFAQGLAKAATERGAQFFGKSPVLSLAKNGQKWIAKTPKGSVQSDWVVVATNAYSDDLLPGLSKSIVPLTPIQISTAPLPDAVINSILPEGHTISDSRRVIMYARREPDNRLVYGGLGRPGPGETLSGFDWLQKDSERVYPQLKGVEWTHQWGGRIAITDDHLPHLHEPQPGLLAGLGYNGRGVAMSMVMGRVLSERVLGADANSLSLPISKIKTVPFRRSKMFGMGTAIWFMRILDYLETR